ncbi:Sperm associated antigen 1 [Sparganum proliferum]
MSSKSGKTFELVSSTLSRLFRSSNARNIPSTTKSTNSGNDAQLPIRSLLENNKSVQFLGRSLEELKKASSSKLEDYVGRFSLVYDTITGRDAVRKAGISVLEAEQAFVDCQLNRRRCQQKLFEVQKKRAEISKQLDIISRAHESFIPLITKEHEYAIEEARLVNEYTEADRLERAAYEKFGSHLRYLHAEERNYDKRMRQWALIGSITLSFLSAAITWFRLRARAVDPDKLEDGLESVKKLVVLSEEIKKSVDSIPHEVVRICSQTSSQPDSTVPSTSSSSLLPSLPVISKDWNTTYLLVSAVKLVDELESVKKLVVLSEEIKKSVDSIPLEVVRICSQTSSQPDSTVPSTSSSLLPSLPVISKDWNTTRLLRKPGKLLSTALLPQEEREEVEDEFQRWLEETKRNETVVKMSLPVIDDETAIPGVPAVRSEGCISAATGKGTKRVTSTTKSSKPRTYEEWAKIEKELEKELEDQENKNDKDFEGAAAANPTGCGDSTSVKPSCAGLAAKAEAMPLAVRRMHAQLEKEKGNEALQAGDNQEALGYYNRSLLYHPTAAVYNNRALLYLKTKKWKLAVSDCNRVLKEEPQNVKALFRRARAFYEIHSLEKAEADLNEVLAIEPDNQRAQNLLKAVKEDHTKRQRSNIEGGRRMVIEEDESDDDDDDDGEEDDDDDNSEEEEAAAVAAAEEAERRRRTAETRAAMESARNPTPSSSYASTSTNSVTPSSRRTSARPKGPERTPYGDSSPVRRGVVLEEVTDDSDDEEEEEKQEEMQGIQNGRSGACGPSNGRAQEENGDTSRKPVAFAASRPSTVQRTEKNRERSREENEKEVTSEETDPEVKNKKRRARLIRRLKSSGPENLNTMLDIKLDAEMLEDYIYGLQTICLPQSEHEFIYKVLESISRSPRFGIACLLLDAEAAGGTTIFAADEDIKKAS